MMPRLRLNLLIMCCLTLLTCAGCIDKIGQDLQRSFKSITEQTKVAPHKAKDEKYAGGYHMHTVKLPNESMSIIAEWFTGDAMNWKELAKCNPKIKPNRIFLGDTIRIPKIMMTRWEPIPPEFVAKYQPETKRKQGKSSPHTEVKPAQANPTPQELQAAPEPAKEEIPVLFGPKNYPKE